MDDDRASGQNEAADQKPETKPDTTHINLKVKAQVP